MLTTPQDSVTQAARRVYGPITQQADAFPNVPALPTSLDILEYVSSHALNLTSTPIYSHKIPHDSVYLSVPMVHMPTNTIVAAWTCAH